MLNLYRKEISSFYSNFAGYVIIVVFLLVNSLFIWVFEGNYNIPEAGYANLDPLFMLAPWIFLFLVPAVTMRLFAEEKRTGTLELLLTRPLTDLQIIMAKYLAALTLVLSALVPTLVYFWSVYRLGSPPGNIDSGGVWGSYIGLFFLASIYGSAGIFVSSWTDNQIISFVVSVLFCFFMFLGFDLMASLDVFSGIEYFIVRLGINEHYRSMRRGVIDTRDLVYFVTVAAFFVFLTRMVLQSRKKKSLRKRQLTTLASWLIILFLVNYISSHLFRRIDLTSEKRHTISATSRKILKGLDETVFIRVYLDGELPPGFVRMKRSISELLDNFRAWAGDELEYEFVNPVENAGPDLRNEIIRELYGKGLQPTNVKVRERRGGTSQKILFPGAMVHHRGVEVPLNLLKNNPGLSGEMNLLNSTQSLEYAFISMIRNVTTDTIQKVAFIEGHGELDQMQVADITRELANFYQVDRGRINGKAGSLDPYEAIIIARPQKPFEKADKYAIDQYIMKGGTVLWLLDPVKINTDSLFTGATIALPRDLNLMDQLFRYGARIDYKLVQDIQCHVLPVGKGLPGGNQQWELAPWYYYPLLSPRGSHPVTSGLNMVLARYAGKIDTVGNDPRVDKTVLLATSPHSRLVETPARISLKESSLHPGQMEFSEAHLPVAVLLEGRFSSVFRNRSIPGEFGQRPPDFLETSVPTRMIVISDGDMIRNERIMTRNGPAVAELGFDKYTSQVFGNKDFIMNAVNYLTDHTGLMSLRSREFKMRLLDRKRIMEEETLWEIVNAAVPVLMVLVAGFVVLMVRKRLYGLKN